MEEAVPSIMMIATSIFFLYLISKTFILGREGKHRKLPPSPANCLPLIGHLHLIIGQPLHRCLDNLINKYGHVMFLQLGTRKVLVIASPSAVEECFTKNDITFANRPKTLAGKHLNYNSKAMGFAPYGDHWRNLRRLTTLELLSTNRLASFARIREEEVQLMVKQLFQDCCTSNDMMMMMLKVELRPRFLALSFNIMMRMISGKRYYGKDGDTQEGKEFQNLMKEFAELNGSGNLNDFFPILQWVDFQGIEKKMVKLMKNVDGFFQRLLDEHQRKRMSVISEGKEHWEASSLIDLLLDLQETEPEFYTPDTVKGLIMALVVAGSETSSTTLEWAVSLLLNNPETMNKLSVEIDTHAGHLKLLNESDSTKLKYLHNVITETLRLYPVAPLLIPHESSTDCKVCGFDIPSGTMLLVNLWTLHRDPSFWVDPTRFMPERFERGDEVNNYNMIPFGVGRRACPGSVLAKRVMGHALGALIQCFEWNTINGDHEEIDMAEGLGITMPKVEPLVAFCRPRKEMIDVISNI